MKVVAAQQRIESLISKARMKPVSDDLELQAHLAAFLCVLSSGLMEQALIAFLDNYARARSHINVAQFVSSQLSRINNAKFEDILISLGKFDPNWRKHIEDSTSSEIKDAIDSIVNNRNQIAHGKAVGISLGTFNRYYGSLKIFIVDLDAFIGTA